MLFEAPNIPPTKMSMSSLYFHVLLYYDNLYTMALIPFQLFLFIFKYNSLYYTTGTIAGEIILLVLAFFVNWMRITAGEVANKGKNGVRYIFYFLFSILITLGYVYLLVWQSYIYWLECIMYIIGLVIIGLEIVSGILAAIVYKASD